LKEPGMGRLDGKQARHVSGANIPVDGGAAVVG
jgi:hypothetical protein